MYDLTKVFDLLNAIPRHLKNTRPFIASSIELVYIFIGYPNAITKLDLPPTMYWGGKRTNLWIQSSSILLIVVVVIENTSMLQHLLVHG